MWNLRSSGGESTQTLLSMSNQSRMPEIVGTFCQTHTQAHAHWRTGGHSHGKLIKLGVWDGQKNKTKKNNKKTFATKERKKSKWHPLKAGSVCEYVIAVRLGLSQQSYSQLGNWHTHTHTQRCPCWNEQARSAPPEFPLLVLLLPHFFFLFFVFLISQFWTLPASFCLLFLFLSSSSC